MGHDVLGVVILMAFVMLHPPIEGKLPGAPVIKIGKADCVLLHSISIATTKYSPKVLIFKPITFARVARIGSTISCCFVETWLMIFLDKNNPFVRLQILIGTTLLRSCVLEANFVVQIHSTPFIKAKKSVERWRIFWPLDLLGCRSYQG
jgi:hypothetical protein